MYLFIADHDSSSSSFTLNSIQPAVRAHGCCPADGGTVLLPFQSLFYPPRGYKLSRSSSSDGHCSWNPRKTTSRKRTGIKLSGHMMSQINNKPKHSCLLSLVTMAAGRLALQAVVWVIYCLQGSDCVCVTTRSEVKQARGQSNDCSTMSRRVIDDDNLSCIRGHSSRRSRRTRTGIENRGDGHIYSSQVCVHAQRSPDGKWVCLGYRLPAASYFSHVEAITWLRLHCELLSLAERPRWRPADKRSRTS